MLTHAPMVRALVHRVPRAGFGVVRAVRKLPYAAFVLVIAIVAVCGMAIAHVPSRWSAGTVEPSATESSSSAGARSVEPAPARARCPGCGVVESIRPLAASAGQPSGYEFTVRLRDGSARVSRTDGPGSWRVGDRIILMSGAGESREQH